MSHEIQSIEETGTLIHQACHISLFHFLTHSAFQKISSELQQSKQRLEELQHCVEGVSRTQQALVHKTEDTKSQASSMLSFSAIFSPRRSSSFFRLPFPNLVSPCLLPSLCRFGSTSSSCARACKNERSSCSKNWTNNRLKNNRFSLFKKDNCR